MFRPLAAGALVVAIAATAAAASAQIDPRTALLEQAGWDALAAGRTTAAAAAFEQALGSDPNNARLHMGAGLAAFLEHRDVDARQELTRALQMDGSLTQARSALAQVLYRAGELFGAIDELERVVAAQPANADARAALDRWRQEADLRNRSETAGDPRFNVFYQGPAQAELATEILASLDRAYWRVGGVLGIYPAKSIPVVLYTTQQFVDVTRSPAWAAAAYDGTIRVPTAGALADRDELDRVLAHEFTHALVAELAPSGVPLWLNEGLASALERAGIDWAARARELGGALPVTALPASFGSLSGSDAQRAYASSAAAVERLIAMAGGGAIVNLLRDLGRGMEFAAAFERRVFVRFADFAAGLGG
jgi:tetratricopeptide (TPR) repeat protein